MKKLLTLAAALLLVAATLLLTGHYAGNRTALPSESSLSGGEGTDLEVTFFEAGKADAILLTTPSSAVLIDCGVKGFGQTILDALAQKGIDHLDCLIVTHFDQDHVGGAAKVLNNLPVTRVLQSNCPKDSSEYEKYLKALRNAGMEPETVAETLSFTLDGVLYTVDPPHAAAYSKDASNNSSLVVTVLNGETSFLFTGDAQTQRLQELLDGGLGNFDVLKVPHHGGEEPLMDALAEATRPRYAVITSSAEEPEAASTLEALARCGTETLLTREGTVVLHSDGATLTVTQEPPLSQAA